MIDARMDQAMSRIEAALARIEEVSRAGNDGDASLASRHEALRSRVAAALSDLDALIGELEP